MILAIFKVHYHQHRDLPPTSQFGETIKIIATGLVRVSWLWSFNHIKCSLKLDFDQNSFKELDDHIILVKFFKDFDQNYDEP